MSGLVRKNRGETPEPLAPIASAAWLHCCNGLDPRRDGGMVPSILGMAGALAASGEPIAIITPTPSRLDGTPLPPGVELFGPETDLEASIQAADVVHFHGLWQGHTRRGARAAREANVPYIMAAHGMAEPWALRHKAFKKKVYTALVEGKNLRRASCLHALSRPEVGHLRALAPRTPIALIPNGVDLHPFDALPPRSALEAEYPELLGKFVVLFFGRLHAKKGLDLLAKALAGVGRDHADLHVLLAGNDDGTLGPFLAEAEALGVRRRITAVGHVTGQRARSVWAAADAFALPSYSEGFSMAILEALACRLPVLATTACHFPELARADGAFIVEPTEAGVAGGLRELVESPAARRAEVARNGRALVEARYTWGRQADRLAEVYDWVAGGGGMPPAVLEARAI